MQITFEVGPKTQKLFEQLISGLRPLKDIELHLRNSPNTGLGDSLKQIAQSVGEISSEIRREHLQLQQGAFLMIKVKADNPDVSYSFSDKVTDSEGNEITDPAVLSTLVTEIVSDNPDAVLLTPVDGKSGSAKFASPGVATVSATVKTAEGVLLGSGAVSFTVTTGDPAAISDIALKFGDLADE